MRTTYVRAGIVHVISKGKFYGKVSSDTVIKAGAKVTVGEPDQNGLVSVTDENGSSEQWCVVELPRRQKKSHQGSSGTNGKQQSAA